MNSSKKILISPLDWGLGHAVRDVPLINKLLKANFEVIVAGSGFSIKLLKEEFPNLLFYNLPSSAIKYPRRSIFFIFALILQVPKFVLNIKKENKQVRKIVEKEKVDLIISDNRYGVYSKKIPSLFISHQIFIKLPKSISFFEKIINRLQKRYIRKFNKCLIPDNEGTSNISGKLSHRLKLHDFYQYIGVLSQFTNNNKEYKKKYDILFILSGPEPQRTILFNKVLSQLKKTNKKVMIVEGIPGNSTPSNYDKIEIKNHLSRQEMKDAIMSSEIVISRAGYTSIMDLVKLKKKAILIPTPGQSEQIYLSEYLSDKKLFVFENQKNFNITNSINKLKNLKADFSIYNNTSKVSFIEIIKNFIYPEYLDSEKCVKKYRKT